MLIAPQCICGLDEAMARKQRSEGRRIVERGEMRPCSEEFGVVTVTSKGGETTLARMRPCEECPWRKDVPVGRFPAQAFRESAPTAYDMAGSTFGCHMSSERAPATCAGFLLRHGAHNLGVRLSLMRGRLDLSGLVDAGLEIFETYREMAIANGVDPEDPVRDPVRGNDDP